MFRRPQYRGEQAQRRTDEVLIQAVNEATCWLSVQEYEDLEVSLHAAALQTATFANKSDALYPVPNEAQIGDVTRAQIVPTGAALAGTFVIEAKHGGEADAEAVVIRTYPNADGQGDDDGADGIYENLHDAVRGKRFVRIRCTAYVSDTKVNIKRVRSNGVE